MLLLVLLAVCDLAVVGAAVSSLMHAGLAMVAHFAFTLMSLAVWWHRGAARRFAPAVSLAFGPVGIVGAMIAPPFGALADRSKLFGRHMQVTKRNRQNQRPNHRLQASEGVMVARLLDGRVRHPNPDSLGSLISVMRHGSLDHRRGALETAVRSFDPRLSKVVALALTDDDQTIRALAAAAANRLITRLAEDRRTLAKALAEGNETAVLRLCALLTDHSRFDVLLSPAQRDQIRAEISKALGVGADREAHEADDEGHLIRNLNHHWAARDFDVVDRLCAEAVRKKHPQSEPLWTAAAWWAAQPCS